MPEAVTSVEKSMRRVGRRCGMVPLQGFHKGPSALAVPGEALVTQKELGRALACGLAAGVGKERAMAVPGHRHQTAQGSGAGSKRMFSCLWERFSLGRG